MLTRKPAVLVAGTFLAALVLAGCGSNTRSSSAASGGSSTGSTSTSPAPSATGGMRASAAPSMSPSMSPSAMGMSASASPSYGPPASGPHNTQDVAFVKDMLPHHAQAVEMADMALGRKLDPRILTLARQIKGAQAPEIATMSGWLVGWGEQVPASGTGGHDMGAMGGATGGMMSEADMTALQKATGKEFAAMWLTDMTKHHTGAVEMARMEIKTGQNPAAKKLAANIVSSQSAEITTMKQLLAGAK